MVSKELFVQFLLKEIKYNPNWHVNRLNYSQKHCILSVNFKKTPPNHDLATDLFEKGVLDIKKYYENNYTYEDIYSRFVNKRFIKETDTYILGTEFHHWADKKLDILNTKRVGVHHYIVTQCIPSDKILLPIIQLARRKNKRISPEMLVQHLIGEIDLLNQFFNL